MSDRATPEPDVAEIEFVETEVANETADGDHIDGDGATGYSYLAAKTSEGWKFLSAHIS